MPISMPSDVRSYVPPDVTIVARDLEAAREWVEDRVVLNGHTPEAVRAAVGLMAALIADDPLVIDDEARVPNMVRLMVLPWAT